MSDYWGMFQQDDVARGSVVSRNTSTGAAVNADALPKYRIYGPDGDMVASGTAAFKDSGTITGATNANPIVITSANHGLTNGTRVTITGVGGNTNANTTAIVANVATNTFELTGVSGNSNYTSGGTWNVTGLYEVTQTVTIANGYTAGEVYSVWVYWLVSSVAQGSSNVFQVM